MRKIRVARKCFRKFSPNSTATFSLSRQDPYSKEVPKFNCGISSLKNFGISLETESGLIS